MVSLNVGFCHLDSWLLRFRRSCLVRRQIWRAREVPSARRSRVIANVGHIVGVECNSTAGVNLAEEVQRLGLTGSNLSLVTCWVSVADCTTDSFAFHLPCEHRHLV